VTAPAVQGTTQGGARVGAQGGINVNPGQGAVRVAPNTGAGAAARASGNVPNAGNVPNVGNAAGRAVDGTTNTVRRVPTDIGNAADAGRVTGRADADISGSANLRTRGTDGRADARVDGRGSANLRNSANWNRFDRNQFSRANANVRAALQGNANANVGMHNWLSGNPQRASYWNNWGSGVRGNFYAGGNPYFGGRGFYNQNFWSGRNLIGLGLAAAGIGNNYNYGPGYGGYNGWWGYQPWSNAHPWHYWWGRPSWNSFYTWFPSYGWNQPYYYDYGPSGNVVYTSNQVLVNGQPVGTPSEYAQTAAELAAIDLSAIQQTAPEDWMPLGTFSFAITQNEVDPPRVIQLAVNKQGLVSGTVYNRNSDKLYTVQGRVDPETQRVAFTIGENRDTVLETGLYNLTQDQTPVLAHFGPTQTATYLFARLQAPEGETQATATQNAAAPGADFAR
jgi:hypothetical protein